MEGIDPGSFYGGEIERRPCGGGGLDSGDAVLSRSYGWARRGLRGSGGWCGGLWWPGRSFYSESKVANNRRSGGGRHCSPSLFWAVRRVAGGVLRASWASTSCRRGKGGTGGTARRRRHLAATVVCGASPCVWQLAAAGLPASWGGWRCTGEVVVAVGWLGSGQGGRGVAGDTWCATGTVMPVVTTVVAMPRSALGLISQLTDPNDVWFFLLCAKWKMQQLC